MANDRIQRIGERVYAADDVERQQDQLQDLLEHCERNDPGEGFKLTDAEQAYHDVAVRLRAILGGE